MDNINSILKLITYFLNLDFDFFGFSLKYIDVIFSCFSFWVLGRILGGGSNE